MSILAIKNATVVLPGAVAKGNTILAIDGKITSVDAAEIPTGATVIDGIGKTLLAGFVDLHVHGGGGADFMDATPAAFETVVKSHLAHGTTLIYPTAMAAPHKELAAFLDAYHAFCEESALAPLAPGVHFEGPYFFGATGASRGAQKAGALRNPDMEEVKILLERAKGRLLRWDAAPELPGACAFASYITKKGVLAAVGHTDATAAETAAGYDAGFRHVTHFYNATSCHRKREQTVYAGVVEATYLDDRVSVELIGDGCHIAKEDMLLALKIKGPMMVPVITDGMRISGTDMQFGKLGGLATGTDVLVEAGVAKLLDRTSFAGSIATMDRCLRTILSFGIDLPTASVMLSLAPATLMGAGKEKGSIEVGKDADLVLIDDHFTVTDVFVAGKKAL